MSERAKDHTARARGEIDLADTVFVYKGRKVSGVALARLLNIDPECRFGEGGAGLSREELRAEVPIAPATGD